MSSGTEESTQQSQSFLPIQAEWLTNLLQMYGPEAGAGQPVYPGAQVAPLTPTQTGAITGAQGLTDFFAGQREQPMFGQTGTALEGLLSGQMGAGAITPEQTEQLFSSIYEKPSTRYYEQYTKPGIRESYAGPGFWSSARAGAQARGAQELGETLGRQRGEFGWGVEQANRAAQEAAADRALSALGPAMGYAGMPMQQAQQQLAGLGGIAQFGSMEQQQQQAEINAAIQNWAAEQNITDPQTLQIIMSLLGMSYSTSTGSASSWGANIGVGGGGTGFAGWGPPATPAVSAGG